MSSSVEHKDLLGQTIAKGDFVVFPSHNCLSIGTVAKINPKMVKVVPIGVSGYWSRGTNKYPNDIVKIEGAHVTMYLLKEAK
jgi:hypothetical protein